MDNGQCDVNDELCLGYSNQCLPDPTQLPSHADIVDTTRHSSTSSQQLNILVKCSTNTGQHILSVSAGSEGQLSSVTGTPFIGEFLSCQAISSMVMVPPGRPGPWGRRSGLRRRSQRRSILWRRHCGQSDILAATVVVVEKILCRPNARYF